MESCCLLLKSIPSLLSSLSRCVWSVPLPSWLKLRLQSYKTVAEINQLFDSDHIGNKCAPASSHFLWWMPAFWAEEESWAAYQCRDIQAGNLVVIEVLSHNQHPRISCGLVFSAALDHSTEGSSDPGSVRQCHKGHEPLGRDQSLAVARQENCILCWAELQIPALSQA